MTTAARPTFDPAKGGSGIKDKTLTRLTQQVSSRDLPGHLSLKERKSGQGTTKELRNKDFRHELEEREKIAYKQDQEERSTRYVPSLEQASLVNFALKAEKQQELSLHKDAILAGEVNNSPEHTNIRQLAHLDVDEDFGNEPLDNNTDLDNSDIESDIEDDDDDDDDPIELIAELNRIKAEREAEEKNRMVKQEDSVSEYSEASFRVARRWDDDVPFKNCAKEPESTKKLYLNDTLRQEFHRKFMDKYIK